MEGIAILFIVGWIVFFSFVSNAAKKAGQSGGNPANRASSGMHGASRAPGAYTGSATSEQRARLEQLRRLQQQRQAAGSAAGDRGAMPYQEKPVYPHETEDCGGGSIHDGYHEGTVRRPAPASSAEGRVGKQGVSAKEGHGAAELYKKDWGERRTEKAAIDKMTPIVPPAQAAEPISAQAKVEPSGAEKLSKAIADKPAIVQGLIWAEVLNRPLADN